jgi:hypothetical protein
LEAVDVDDQVGVDVGVDAPPTAGAHLGHHGVRDRGTRLDVEVRTVWDLAAARADGEEACDAWVTVTSSNTTPDGPSGTPP